MKRNRVWNKLTLLAAALAFAALSGWAVASEDQDEWKEHQIEFLELLESKTEADASDFPGRDSWKAWIRRIKIEGPLLRGAILPEAGIHDRCITCHLGADNPAFADAPEPLRSHPGKTLNRHPVAKFGCTICHGGNGEATTAEAAHGTSGSSADPLVPAQYMQSACIGCHETSYGLEGAEKLEAGRLAFEKYACYACHKARGLEKMPMFAPPMQDLKKKLKDTRWLISWLRNPKKMNPRTVMPDFKLSDEEIRDISAFLLSLETEAEYPEIDLSAASAEEGKKLFTDLGCKACHSDSKEEESFRRRVPNLADAGIKLKTDWILEELKNPKGLNPDARIPKLDITDADFAHIIVYLTTLKANADVLSAETLSIEGPSIENGKELVKKYGCYGCHKIEGFEKEDIPSIDVAGTARKPPAELPPVGSEAEGTRWASIHKAIIEPRHYETEDRQLKAPEYIFDEGEAESLTTFYLNNYRFPLPEDYMAPASQAQLRGQTGERIVTDRNCRGCHMLEEGVQPRIEKFIGLKTYVPPRLVGEGEKVRPEWAAKYLEKPEPMRPWLMMRMPDFSFTKEEARVLVEYFSVKAVSPEDARLPYALPFEKDEIPQLEIEMGEYRLGFDKCMQCHPVSMEEGLPEDVQLEDLSINLMLSKKRLRFEWIKNFLKNPDRYAGAGTKMPYVYYTPEGAPKVSEAEMWIDYVAKFLMVMEKVPEPPEEEKEEEEEIDWTMMDY